MKIYNLIGYNYVFKSACHIDISLSPCTGFIIGGIIGALVVIMIFIVLIILVVLCLVKKGNRGSKVLHYNDYQEWYSKQFVGMVMCYIILSFQHHLPAFILIMINAIQIGYKHNKDIITEWSVTLA